MQERTPRQFEWIDNSRIAGTEFKRSLGQHIFLLNHGISLEVVSLSKIRLTPIKFYEPYTYELLIHEEGVSHEPSRLNSYNVYRLRGTDFIFAGDQSYEKGADTMTFVVSENHSEAVLPEEYSEFMNRRERFLKQRS